MKVKMNFGTETVEVSLPEKTKVLSMSTPRPLTDPAAAVRDALNNSLGSPGLDRIIEEKLRVKPDARAVVVISDNTRPVPYRGDKGILWPVVERLLAHNISKERILILVATGTHRLLSEEELREMLDPRIFEAEIPIKNHDCRDEENLVYLGETRRGSKVYINRNYVEADLKILTGLVESHFMAGASGGRKSVCPGLIGEESTYIFHGAPILASPQARDLVLDGNPCHEEALEVAKKAGVDYIINVTLDHEFNLTGVFAGELEAAHKKAVERIKEYVALPVDKEYDIVVTHAGFVGINHYQAAKVGVVSIPAVKPGGRLIVAANNTDSDPVGSPMYRTVLHLLTLFGAERFNRLILSPDWSFIPEQWQVQMWAKLFAKIPQENFIYYSPQLAPGDYRIIPGRDGNLYLPEEERYRGSLAAIPRVIENAVEEAVLRIKEEEKREAEIAYLADGPYGVPVKRV